MVGFVFAAPTTALVGASWVPEDIAGSFNVSCQLKFDGTGISCEFHFNEPKWVTFVKDAALWVAKEAKALWDETGKVVSCVLHKAKFVADEIVTAAEKIKNATVEISSEIKDEVEEWATNFWDELGEAVVIAYSNQTNDIVNLVDDASDGNVWDAIKDGASYVWDSFKNPFGR